MARHDAAVGRYVYLSINGIEYRVYYESNYTGSGAGIPLICQHTAGAHGFQWRHLLEDREVTDRYRVFAWDLPFHGKSLPPLGDAHWTKPYNLTRDFFLKFITGFAKELELDKPVFIGCSMGGQVAVDLCAHHPDEFRACIGVEASLVPLRYDQTEFVETRTCAPAHGPAPRTTRNPSTRPGRRPAGSLAGTGSRHSGHSRRTRRWARMPHRLPASSSAPMPIS